MITKRRNASKKWRKQYEMDEIEQIRLLRLSKLLWKAPVREEAQ